MGDWAMTTYWGEGSRPRLGPVWFQRWGAEAARVGWVGSAGLWQTEVLMRYGTFPFHRLGHPWLLGVGPDASVEQYEAPLRAGWNYVRSDDMADLPLFEAAAGQLDNARAVHDGVSVLLCLSDMLPCGKEGMVDWDVEHADVGFSSEASTVRALALAGARTWSARRSFVLGLWTPEFGYLHTGRLHLDLDAGGGGGPLGYASRTLTGICNELSAVEVSGPYAHYVQFQRRTTPVPTVPFPYL